MSQNPPVSGRSPSNAHPHEDRGSLDRKRRHAGDEEFPPAAERRESVRSRPLSWHPSAPVEPPLKASEHRSIGVSSILNHPTADRPGLRTASVDSGREGLGEQPSFDAPSHSRYPSSATVHLPSPLMHPSKPPALSPGLLSHQSITPISPSSRFVGAGGYFPPKAGPGQSPLIQQLPGLQTVTPNSPLAVDTPGHPQPMPGHHHQASTSTFNSQRAGMNHTPTPSSKEGSPTTPVSVFSQMGRSSPAIVTAPIPHSAPQYMNATPFAPVDPVNRLHAALPPHRRSVDEVAGVGGSHLDPPRPGMIACTMDFKSGSSSQAEKRKANSDASRRFRHRKKHEADLEQKNTALQDELRKKDETIQKQADEIRTVMEQREFYRSERDYFRDQASHLVQLPARPTSPKPLRLKSEQEAPLKIEEAAGTTSHHRASGPLAPVSNIPSGPSSRPGGNWSAPSYSTMQGERVDDRQARQMPSTSGAWNRTA
ncbi:hypothetical protein BJY04DRAFT_214343 [Aspergillus karnatakaensis]|uniref:uncharacterized protein n=1 Tax=Aspergillus karnatakaensis TaxID=1810916 RepID=UPI003CCE2E74